MKRMLTAAAVALACASTATAAGYDDFTTGMTANLQHNYPRAVTAFSPAPASICFRPIIARGRWCIGRGSLTP